MATMEEKRAAKNAAWRAAQGLPPKGQKKKLKLSRKMREVQMWADSVHDPLDDKDNLGLSPDC